VLNEAACHHLTKSWHIDICCVHGREEYTDSFGKLFCKENHEGVHRPPLLSPASEAIQDDEPAPAQAIADEWHSAAARLLSHVPPGCLALSLVCDIDPQHPRALEVANSVVAPVRLLPRAHLRECHIRLAKTTDRRLQLLAEDTVSHACGIPAPSPTPPSNATATLITLPRELRNRILEYTDLVTPSREVLWDRLDRAYVVMSLYCDPLFECWPDRTDEGGPPTNGCFCRRRHAAFSPACKCWAPPGPALFLICRALYEDAQFVFFSSNRVIVHDYKPRPPWVLPLLEQHEGLGQNDESIPAYDYPNERFAASEFLREIAPTHSLAHLRFLELVFPPYRPGSWPETQHPAMQDWWATVEWLRDKINTPGLTIRLMVAEASSCPDSYNQAITVEDGDTIMTAYMDLMRPLTRLAGDGLGRFYASFPYPWELTEESRTRDMNETGWLRAEEEALKERAERYVMGHRYESLRKRQRGAAAQRLVRDILFILSRGGKDNLGAWKCRAHTTIGHRVLPKNQ
jgi:hypothetical protein